MRPVCACMMGKRGDVSEKESTVTALRIVIAVLLLVTGVVWFLQGINILPGSFMTGDFRWAIAGAVAAFVGLVVLIWPSRAGGEKE